MFAPRTVKNEPVGSKIGLISKKIFALSLVVLFVLLYVRQLLPDIDRTLHPSEVIIFVISSFAFTLLFTKHPTKTERASTSDWALLALLGVTGLGLYLTNEYILGIGGVITATILTLFIVGLGLYVWRGADNGVRFVLFSRDRRYKFNTYLKHTASEWIIASISIICIIGILSAINMTFPKNQYEKNTQREGRSIASDILIQPTHSSFDRSPTDIQVSPTVVEAAPSPEPTIEPTPEVTPPIELPAPENYALYVLNGSGTPGAASNIKKIIEEGGLVVDYIGDASTFTYENVQVRYNVGFEDIGVMIQQLLKPHYAVVDLAQFGPTERYRQYDVVVIHGR